MTPIVAQVIGLSETGAYQGADPQGETPYGIPHDVEDQRKQHLSYLRQRWHSGPGRAGQPFPEKEFAQELGHGNPDVAHLMRGTGIADDPLKPGFNVAGGRAGSNMPGRGWEPRNLVTGQPRRTPPVGPQPFESKLI